MLEQGDPRGALMRLDPNSREHDQLVHENWARWFPGIERTSLRGLRWRNGFVSELELVNAVPLELPGFRHLRAVSISLPAPFDLEPLNSLPLLRSLRISLPWGHPLGALSPALRRAHSLELALFGGPSDGSLDLHGDLPELRHLVIDAVDLPQQTLGNLTVAPWLARLESLAIGDVGNANAGPILNRGHAFERLGSKLHFELRRDAWPDQRNALHKKFPEARLRFPDVGAYRFPFRERGLWAVREPVDAPKNFRTLPAEFTRIGDGAYGAPGDTLVSSGAPFAHLRNERFCAWCASDRTLAIYAQSQVDEDVRYGNSTWWLCEWRCEECGWITTPHRIDAS
ncbi:MAG: hypothetical protein QM817_14020 [Archangium sp.]